MNHRSVNEVICHGIPDMRPLENGDLLNSECVSFFFFSLNLHVCNQCLLWKERYTEDCCFDFTGELIYVSGYIFVFVCHDVITLFGLFS